jgi:hypothetical protein
MKFLYTFIFFVILLTSCQVKIKDVNPPSGTSKLTVDGTITDSIGHHYVRLTKTVDILSTETTPGVNDAMVLVVNNTTGFRDTFKLSPQRNGYYIPSKIWAGIPGNSYTLKVVTTDQTVTASETMPDWPDFKIDSLVPIFREPATKNRLTNGLYNDRFYSGPYIKESDSLYRVKIYAMSQLAYRVNIQTFVLRNSSPFYSTEFFINNLNQVPLDNNYVYPPGGGGPPTNVHFLLGDNVTVSLRGITNECYEYYRALNAVLNSDGGLFNSPPGNPVNNMNNKEVLGYFKTVVTTSKTITISTANRKF